MLIYSDFGKQLFYLNPKEGYGCNVPIFKHSIFNVETWKCTHYIGKTTAFASGTVLRTFGDAERGINFFLPKFLLNHNLVVGLRKRGYPHIYLFIYYRELNPGMPNH